ncbi:hypothetical protein P691DRAFT_793593 [Macrolepiota fuliginosa MF-IS2]|uniref:DDE-1 domain-containing protein n=1 Tax=Macrolepiota fuliginosa MF-IS2 TaxID=1400762 RepID=A0A9P5WXN7_9AGAR|nr:hypothetical protein P691DRAFT_793593 [Macrolepiota fuliginosa MF-IS2]
MPGSTDTDGVIIPELIYGADKTGIQKGVGMSKYVIAPRNESIVHQQCSGDQENITIMVTICADGTAIPAAIIFKSEGFQVWLGYSKKGYTDDGHNSHYSYNFLNHAQRNQIHVLCYPLHSTHLYQGLDVIVFNVLKQWQTEEWDKFEKTTRQSVNKTNFLAVLTQENIISAFTKTGIVPFNPNIIPKTSLAPSLETSTITNIIWKKTSNKTINISSMSNPPLM